MPPKLPSVITVGPHKYKLASDTLRISKLSLDTQSNLAGFTDHRQLTIDIDPNQAGDQKADTVLHEVLHAVFNVTDLNGDWTVDQEERIVSRVAPALLDVLRRNPALVAYLTTEVK